jgi:hypothetical protein
MSPLFPNFFAWLAFLAGLAFLFRSFGHYLHI